jgi:DNA-binding CsgD family transcriptional regulator
MNGGIMDGRHFDRLSAALARRLHQKAATPAEPAGPSPIPAKAPREGTCPYPDLTRAELGVPVAICGWHAESAYAVDGRGGPVSVENGRAARRKRLSQRELEVVALIGRGLKDREIAAVLVISQRTVHAHVHNLLGKLDLASRAQIAVWATERGLLSGQPGNYVPQQGQSEAI